MEKRAPSLGRILVAIGFALSCFGLILFLWVAFGGPLPLKPKSYRITAYFPEATQLAVESDVRIGGVTVGKVKDLELAPATQRVGGADATEATLEIEPQFAPISTDARAILRQKTLLGETYVELTAGTPPGRTEAPVALGAAANVSDSDAQAVESIPEGGTLGIGQTKNATQIDEIFNALDGPTRRAFQRWQANAAVAIKGRGLDLNDALGNLGPFVSDASNILATLRRQRTALRGLVRDTGTVFAALSERDRELAGAITGSDRAFGALARRDQALRRTFEILPVFERESRLTLERLDRFQANTRPLVQELLPVANDISPTLRSVRRLSPSLKSLFIDLQPLIRAAHEGLPATSRFLDALRPTLDALDPFLQNLNPVIRYLGFYRTEITNFLTSPAAGIADSLALGTNQPNLPAPVHALRQLGYFSSESLSVQPRRPSTNRGNGYLQPNSINGYLAAAHGIFPNFDCNPSKDAPGANSQGEVNNQPPDERNANCVIAANFPREFGGGQAPNLFAEP
jgi:phospholipid/cholesterol/gamma-HCH transport system substrate-binding protein